jgi:CubicO group peptidase (beta-lactamase class C family)
MTATFWKRVVSFHVACVWAICPALIHGEDRFVGMDEYILAAMQKWEVPGVALSIVKDGEVVLTRGYGVCELGKEHPVTAETLFPLASCAKTFSAATVGLLVDEGKLEWDDPVVRHLPDFELADPYLTKHLTLRDLLSHRTGLQRCDLLGDGASIELAEMLRRLKHVPVVAELRTKYTYSNSMYDVLDEVVARVSRQPTSEVTNSRLFQPLGMKSTASSSGFPVDRVALRHWRSDAGIVSRGADLGIHSTVKDCAQWLKLQLAEGEIDGQRLIQRETVRQMHALQFSIPVAARPTDNIYAAHFYGTGLGWFNQDYRGCKVVLKGGSWGSIMALLPDEQLGIVVLSNLDLESLPGMLMYDVFDAYLVGPKQAWNRDKWDTWLRNEPPGFAYRPRDEARARLEKSRVAGTVPGHALEAYAGVFESKLYGRIEVLHENGRLSLMVGEFTTKLAHWQGESFYARTPTRLTYDWLLTFRPSKDGQSTAVIVKHVGWDKDERDHEFARRR